MLLGWAQANTRPDRVGISFANYRTFLQDIHSRLTPYHKLELERTKHCQVMPVAPQIAELPVSKIALLYDL